MMKQRGILVVVSGFSGVGKGTIMKRLTEKYDNYALSVSATTRDPRAGETDGKDYFFHTAEEFQRMIACDELVEYACYCGNYYGTPRKYVEDQMERGRDVILEIEIQGALKIKAKYPDALLLFDAAGWRDFKKEAFRKEYGDPGGDRGQIKARQRGGRRD